MSDPNEPVFSGGRPNPELAGIPLRLRGSGSEPDPGRIVEAARILGRPVKYVDDDGYDQEIIAASDIGPNGELAYVACAAKELDEYVAVSFEFRVRDASSREVASEIESYNPYFGCDVGFLEWFGSTAVLIYREKHDTYVSVCTSQGPAQYRAIAHQWVVNSDQLGYWKYKDTQVKRLSLPQLGELEPVSEAEALREGLCPSKQW